MAARGLSALDAVRAASLAISSLEEVVSTDKVLIIRSDNRTNDVRIMIEEIATFLGLSIPPETRESIIKKLSLQEDVQGGIHFESQRTAALRFFGLPDSDDTERAGEVSELAASLADYDQLLRHGFIHSLRWPGALFHLLDKQSGPAIEAVDLTGPARFLVSGPYLGLPRGRWNAELAFSVWDNLSGNRILIDISTNSGETVLAKKEYILPKEGAFKCKLSFETVQSHLAIEIRTFLVQGAIEGSFCFQEVGLTRQL